jgi:hypothetical protein
VGYIGSPTDEHHFPGVLLMYLYELHIPPAEAVDTISQPAAENQRKLKGKEVSTSIQVSL